MNAQHHSSFPTAIGGGCAQLLFFCINDHSNTVTKCRDEDELSYSYLWNFLRVTRAFEIILLLDSSPVDKIQVLCTHVPHHAMQAVRYYESYESCAGYAGEKHGANPKDSANQSGGHSNKNPIYVILFLGTTDRSFRRSAGFYQQDDRACARWPWIVRTFTANRAAERTCQHETAYLSLRTQERVFFHFILLILAAIEHTASL